MRLCRALHGLGMGQPQLLSSICMCLTTQVLRGAQRTLVAFYNCSTVHPTAVQLSRTMSLLRCCVLNCQTTPTVGAAP